MKKLMIILSIVVILSSPASIADSQTPLLRVYFDPYLTRTFAYCPGAPVGTVIETLYVVAENFDSWLAAIEYRVDYPPQLIWLGDMWEGLSIGTTVDGISTTWPIPQNAFGQLVVARVVVMWTCEICTEFGVPLCVNVHPSSGYLRAITWPDLKTIYGTTAPACICPGCCPCVCPDPPIPTKYTSWGRVKALLSE